MCGYLLASHGAVLVSLLVSNVPVSLVGISALLLVFSATYHVHSLNRQTGPYPVRGLTYREGQWFVQTEGGERSVSLKGSWVLVNAVGLHLDAEPSIRLLLLPDSCNRGDFRRLRQILRFARSVPGDKNRIERLG